MGVQIIMQIVLLTVKPLFTGSKIKYMRLSIMQLTSIWLSTWWIFLAMGMIGWVFSLRNKNVNNVDSIWSNFFLVAALYVAFQQPELSDRQVLVLVLLAIWSVRLSVFLGYRNFGKAEDWRYAAMRNKRGDSFSWRSIYVVYVLQAAIAMVIFAGLLPGLLFAGEVGTREIIAAALALLGIAIEAIGDWQLFRFKADKNNVGKVLDTGLWAYTRHPNYFGESVFWWSLFLLTVQMGTFWTILSPVIVTFLLLRVSGVWMMEKGRTGKNPVYQKYQQETSVFIPRFRKVAASTSNQTEDKENAL
jgi:steroid 5-alpha reductase family enzyme